jgi:hypothetical protein
VQDKAANNRAAPARPTPLSRFPTSTVYCSKYRVPWLSAQGPLAYSPVEPPARDYNAANRDIWRKYLGVQAQMLSDSVLSFNTIHDRVKRSETEGLRHETWLGDTMAAQAGLDIESPGFAKDLWHAAQQGYSLDPVIGVREFGPHHVVVKTPLSNIRLTTFFAGASEVKIIDPSRLSLVEAVGCQVDFIPPMEWTTKNNLRDLMLTKPSAELTLFDTLSRLTLVRATKLLDADGNSLITAQVKSIGIGFASPLTPRRVTLALHWPRFDETERATMVFNRNTRIERDPYRELREYWRGMPPAASVLG